MITDRDRKIIDFIYDIGFSNIKIIGDLFFTNSIYRYDLARKRLRKILKIGEYIKSIKNQSTNEVIYIPIDSKIKNISIHNLKILDYICELKLMGADLEEIKIEPIYNNIKPDACIKFVFNNCRYYQLLEVQCRHAIVDLDRYNSNDVIESILKDNDEILPNLIIIQNTNRDYEKLNNTPLNIIQLNLNLDEMAKVLI